VTFETDFSPGSIIPSAWADAVSAFLNNLQATGLASLLAPVLVRTPTIQLVAGNVYFFDCSAAGGAIVATLPVGQSGSTSWCRAARMDAAYTSAGGVSFVVSPGSGQTIWDTPPNPGPVNLANGFSVDWNYNGNGPNGFWKAT
jgi:hypothetical protein